MSNAPRLDPAGVDATVAEVLAQPPFVGGGLDSVSVWRRLWQLLERWYDQRVTDLYQDSPVFFWVVTSVLLAVLVLLLVHMSSSLRDVVRAMRRAAAAGDVVPVPAEAPRLDESRAALARGDHRRAVELAWLVAIQTLAPRRLVERTPRQLYGALWPKLAESERSALGKLLSTHERACYAGVATSAEAAGAALDAAAVILNNRAGGPG